MCVWVHPWAATHPHAVTVLATGCSSAQCPSPRHLSSVQLTCAGHILRVQVGCPEGYAVSTRASCSDCSERLHRPTPFLPAAILTAAVLMPSCAGRTGLCACHCSWWPHGSVVVQPTDRCSSRCRKRRQVPSSQLCGPSPVHRLDSALTCCPLQ